MSKDIEGAKHWLLNSQKTEAISYLNEIRTQIFEEMVSLKLIKSFVFEGKFVNCQALGSNGKVVFVIELSFGQKVPCINVYQSSSRLHVRVSPFVVKEILKSKIENFLSARSRGYYNENLFEESIVPIIKGVNRVVRVNHVSNRKDGRERYDFEIEYYTDRYYQSTNILKIDLKSSTNFQEEGVRNDGVYVFEFNDKMDPRSVLYRIKRLMIKAKNLN